MREPISASYFNTGSCAGVYRLTARALLYYAIGCGAGSVKLLCLPSIPQGYQDAGDRAGISLMINCAEYRVLASSSSSVCKTGAALATAIACFFRFFRACFTFSGYDTGRWGPWILRSFSRFLCALDNGHSALAWNALYGVYGASRFLVQLSCSQRYRGRDGSVPGTGVDLPVHEMEEVYGIAMREGAAHQT